MSTSPFLYATLSGVARAPAGTLLIRTGQGSAWVIYSAGAAGTYVGGQLAVLLVPLQPGQSGPVQTSGFVDPDILSLGSGPAGLVYAGPTPSRQGSQVIGTCDSSGLITLRTAYSTTSVVDTIGGSPWSGTPALGQVPTFNGTGWAPATPTAGGGGATTSTGDTTLPAADGLTPATVTVVSSAGAVKNGPATIAGSFVQVTGISGNILTYLNMGGPANVAPGTPILAGAIVTFGGLPLSQASALLGEQQVQASIAGVLTPTGMRQFINALSQGAHGDVGFDVGGNSGANTDDYALLQAAIDLNAGATTNGQAARPFLFPRSKYSQSIGLLHPTTLYRISAPLCVNDYVSGFGTGGINNTNDVLFDHSGLDNSQDFYGPCIVNGVFSTGASVPLATETVSSTPITCLVIRPTTAGGAYLPLDELLALNHCDGMKQYGLEMWLNPGSDVPPTDTTYFLAQSAGNLGGSLVASAWKWYRRNDGGQQHVVASVTTTTGVYTVSTALGHGLTLSAPNHITWEYDAHFTGRLMLWIGGQQTTNNLSGGTADPLMSVPIPRELALGGTISVVGGNAAFTTSVAQTAPFGLKAADIVNLNGTQATVLTMSGTSGTFTAVYGGATGTYTPVASTIVQQAYESINIGCGGPNSFPDASSGPPGQIGTTGATYHMGLVRLTMATTRYTAPFTPPVTMSANGDGSCVLLVDFGAAEAFPTRQALQSFVIGRSSVYSRNNFPAYLDTQRRARPLPYVSDTRIDGGYFRTAGSAIKGWASKGTRFNNLMWSGGWQGVILEGFSYDASFTNCAGFEMASVPGLTQANGASCDILLGGGSQYSRIIECGCTFGSGNFHVLHGSGTLTVDGGFPNSYKQAAFVHCGNATSVKMTNASYSDELSPLAIAGVIVGPNSQPVVYQYSAGSCEQGSTTGKPIFLFNFPTLAEIKTFCGTTASPGVIKCVPSGGIPNGGYPIEVFSNQDVTNTNPWVDPSGPALVVDRTKIGRHALPMTDADYTMAQNEELYRRLYIPASVTLTAKRKIIMPYHCVNQVWRVQNLSTGGFAVSVIGPSGASFDVPNGAGYTEVYDDGTNMVAA